MFQRMLDRLGGDSVNKEQFVRAMMFQRGAGGRPPEGRPGQPGPGGRGNPEEIARRLKEADKNGDGKISKEEAPEQLKERFDRIDSNGDGQLDEAELKLMFERMREAGGRPAGGRPAGRPERKPEEKKE